MSLIDRYFTVSDEKQAVMQVVLDRLEEENRVAMAEAEAMAAEHGFGSARWIRGQLVGFTMPADADLSGFKCIGQDEEGAGVYRPKWNTSLGRAIRKEFNRIGWTDPREALLQECFPNAKGIMVIGGPAPRWGSYMHSPSLRKLNGRWILEVPAYAKGSDHEGREHYTPDEGVTEISEADYLELTAAALRAEVSENE
jgi:hypothetical protein